ncbi:2-amino-4-hydroxy-6-hydroxymethyldihydropteridine diphosphokinase [Synergistales bacterium]|nr:2-amino-4-hydroxy-6-hydroxymethyldihydropteridine diphosphokinase [Synergistales bacterium]
MTQAYSGAIFSIGSNLGDRLGALRRASGLLGERAGHVTDKSFVYETPPWGVTSQPRFLNACVGARTCLSPRELLCEIKNIERIMGRAPRERWGPREIDIDILLYGDAAVDEPDLKIPHPFMLERAFVLIPLADIFPNMICPLSRSSAAELAEGLSRDGILRITAL